MKILLLSTLIAALVFLIIDIIWLSFAVKNFYRPNIGHLLLERPVMWAAAMFMSELERGWSDRRN